MSATIPCLSLWQPWATLMAIGAKRIETRSWGTHYRGPLAIHAAKRWDSFTRLTALRSPFVDELRDVGYEERLREVPFLPLGSIVAVVDLIDVGPIGDLPPDYPESAFGDYTPGRFAWVTENEREIVPVPWRGRQRLFNIPASVLGVDAEIQS